MILEFGASGPGVQWIVTTKENLGQADLGDKAKQNFDLAELQMTESHPAETAVFSKSVSRKERVGDIEENLCRSGGYTLTQ